MEIKVIRPGMLTTVQDLGRRGMRRAGLTGGGAMDQFALGLANRLVGNEPNTPALEMTLTGPELEFSEEALIAITGAGMGDREHLHPFKVKAGERVKLGSTTHGSRAYLAVAGGLKVGMVLGGAGTDLRAALGGHEGRALQTGDVLHAEVVPREIYGRWWVSPRLLPAYSLSPEVRAIPGAEMSEFAESFWGSAYEISAQSDRMGYRLQGKMLERKTSRELVSAAVIPGTVQVPPDGGPIVLMADAQTIGGYPRIAHVAQVDLPLLAQLRPGDHVTFTLIDLEEAQRLANQRERDLNFLREALRLKVR